MTDVPLEHVHVAPDDGTDGEPAPAVFVLHGRGADEEDLLPVAAELPDELHVISLRAPDPLQGGYTWYELDLSPADWNRASRRRRLPAEPRPDRRERRGGGRRLRT
ncbi:phospholipase/carboxylesterase [Halorubrum sp. AJ67]|nr:phospholipase/carboxylesterase [Halorubrum sp. AJ67]